MHDETMFAVAYIVIPSALLAGMWWLSDNMWAVMP